MSRIVRLRPPRARHRLAFAMVAVLAVAGPMIASTSDWGSLEPIASFLADLKRPAASVANGRSLASRRTPAETIVIARCGDGDTCTAASGEKLRLLEIDAPELGGARCGRERAMALKARDRLSAIVAGKRVQIERGKRDQWGRGLVRIFVDSEDVGARLMREGLAVRWRPGLRNERPGPWC